MPKILYDDFLKLTNQSIIGFTVTERCNKVPDLTPRNVWDLCDIAIRFGDFDYDNFGKPGIFFGFQSLRIEVYNFIGNGAGGSAGFMIGKYRPNKKIRSTSAGCFLLSLLNGMSVIWDRGHTVEEVKSFIYKIDELSYKRNLIVAGRRVVL